MTAWLNHREGLLVNRKRVYRLMRENGLLVEQVRHKAVRSFQRGKPKATKPNQYWGIDMTKFILGVRGQGLSLISDNGSRPTSVAFMTETAGLDINQIFCSYDNPRGNAEPKGLYGPSKKSCCG